MTSTIAQRFLVRGGAAAAVAALNEIPLAREFVIETDTGKIKLGDGATHYNALGYLFGADPELIRDTIAAALVAGAGVTITVNDAGDTITIASSITQYTDEMARDALGAAITAGTGVTVTVNDGADTITLALDTAVVDERARDALGTALVGSTGVSSTVDDAGDTITLRAGAHWPDKLVAGEYYINAVNSSAFSSVAVTADRLDFFYVPPLAQDIAFGSLAIYVVTGVASAKARVGIYSDTGGMPDALLYSAAEMDCATSSTAREDTGCTGTLYKGKAYWLAITSSNGPTLRSVAVAATPCLGMTGLSSTAPTNVRRATRTYAALPSTAPSTSANNLGQPIIALKAT